MMGSLYQALRSANVDDETARKAAEEVAAYDDRFSDVDKRFSDVDRQLTEIRGELKPMRWMIGFVLALSTAILIRLLMT